MIISWWWIEINIKEVIGTYKFYTIPREFFHMSDSVHPWKNNVESMYILEQLPEESNDDEAMNEVHVVDTVPNKNDLNEDHKTWMMKLLLCLIWMKMMMNETQRMQMIQSPNQMKLHVSFWMEQH